MGVTTIIIIASVALVMQVVLLIWIKNMKKKLKKELSNPVLEKYGVRNAGDAWRCLNDAEIPDDEKEVIQDFYQKLRGA